MPKAARITAIVIFAIILLVLPKLVNSYVLSICISTITYSMLGLGFAFSLKVGLPRMDVAAWWAVGAYTSAMLMLKANWPFWPTILVGGILAALLGWLLFVVAIPQGMMCFMMFGLVLGMAIQQLFSSLEFFGGSGGTGILPQPAIGSFTFASKPELYYLGLIFLIVNVLVFYALFNSKIGRAWDAIGSSLKLAKSVGIDVVKYRMANVLIGNFFLAAAGSFYVSYSLVAVPSTFSFINSINVIMYILVGGIAHSLSGPILGALIITFIPQYFRVAKEYEPIITSVFTILLIIFIPMGILGWLDRSVLPRANRFKWFVSRFRAE
jgi:branched-chain amino acid transport system permease protein